MLSRDLAVVYGVAVALRQGFTKCIVIAYCSRVLSYRPAVCSGNYSVIGVYIYNYYLPVIGAGVQ